eukprot:CAMPEP_0172639808 /NCGR_PEP_ID=MMETSP1068-20121228/220012_1 /TAXON_ID=35684 /ORGANISM="Pseudopedinella elastica, Strain CCMP716" /LENGTH=35 /DNA_ID= /DNA_START= /DNA_END= /DNA_ORIENTATION=
MAPRYHRPPTWARRSSSSQDMAAALEARWRHGLSG